MLAIPSELEADTSFVTEYKGRFVRVDHSLFYDTIIWRYNLVSCYMNKVAESWM